MNSKHSVQCGSWLVVLLLLPLWQSAAATAAGYYNCAPVPQRSGGCDAACQNKTGAALLRLYAGLRNGAHKSDWYDLLPMAKCDLRCKGAPAYCGWQGVMCCHNAALRVGSDACQSSPVERDACKGNVGAVWKLDMTMFGLSGTLSDDVIDALKVLTGFGLRSLDLSSNKIHGTIPARISELGKNFTALNVNFNKLTGPVPLSMSRLANLKNLYMSFNKLEGSLQGRFCTLPGSPLEVLIMRSNFFVGKLDVTSCKSLLQLDVTDNQLTGRLPIGFTNSRMISTRVTNNKFSGTIPEDIWRLPLLTTIDLGNNELTGTLSPLLGTTNNLVNIYLGNNNLIGTLPKSLVSNSQLLNFEVFNNTRLTGTFPSTGSLVGLRRLDIHNTAIRGTIPEEWGHLPYLEFVDISGTHMTCCETQEQADNSSFPNLPSFLQFSKRLNQFDLNTPAGASQSLEEVQERGQPNNVLCPVVVRKSQPPSEWNVLELPLTTTVTVDSQKWIVSPLYSWFDDCVCTKHYDKSGSRYRYQGINSWCDSPSISEPNSTANGTCLEMYIFSCQPNNQHTLPPSVRSGIGAATGLVFVLLLGLLCYCMLARASKLRRYLLISAIRLRGPPKYGRMTLIVTDIEGYSDIFRRCPEVMYKALVLHNSVLRMAKYRNGGFVLEQEGDSFTLAFYNPFDALVFCLQAQQALLTAPWPQGLENTQDTDASVHTVGSIGSRIGSRIQMRLSPLLGFGPRMKRTGTLNSAQSVGSNLGSTPSLFGPPLFAGITGSRDNMDEPLFCGLRVRMGVVTGSVPSGTPIKNSALFQLAKLNLKIDQRKKSQKKNNKERSITSSAEVGDFGNGGQVILDQATFQAIKDDAQALGAVDASGLNHSKLSSGRLGWKRLLRMCGIERPRAPTEEVVLLDMGAFCQCTDESDTLDLPYTTAQALDVKQQSSNQNTAAENSWRSTWCLLCSPCCRQNPEDDMLEDPMEGLPRQMSILPPAARSSSPYHLDAPIARLRTQSIGSSCGASSTGPSLLGIIGRAPQSNSVRPDGEAEEIAPSSPKRDAATMGRFMSFSTRATKHLADMRKTLTRSQSFQEPEAVRRDWERVRLYQVLPPDLAGRAHAWHNKLNLKDGWICWDNMYFEAPGSTTAPMTSGRLEVFKSSASYMTQSHRRAVSPPTPSATQDSRAMSPVAQHGDADRADFARPLSGINSSNGGMLQQGQHAEDLSAATNVAPLFGNVLTLPPVTMVFMAVEAPELLVKRRRSFTPVVQSLLNRVVRDALRRIGGYLCRVQEGDLKFMVAFVNPVAALEWCLLVQASAMYLPWPQSAIMLLPSCREQVDNTGRLVFRGPKIKMGVCEGVPRSIIPDHEGRADYHGQSINMAARFMDKGAQGGQIACTLELAQQAMAVWASGGGSANWLSHINHPHDLTTTIAEDDTCAAVMGSSCQHQLNDTAATAAAPAAHSSVLPGGLSHRPSDQQALSSVLEASHPTKHGSSTCDNSQQHCASQIQPAAPAQQERSSSSGSSGITGDGLATRSSLRSSSTATANASKPPTSWWRQWPQSPSPVPEDGHSQCRPSPHPPEDVTSGGSPAAVAAAAAAQPMPSPFHADASQKSFPTPPAYAQGNSAAAAAVDLGLPDTSTAGQDSAAERQALPSTGSCSRGSQQTDEEYCGLVERASCPGRTEGVVSPLGHSVATSTRPSDPSDLQQQQQQQQLGRNSRHLDSWSGIPAPRSHSHTVHLQHRYSRVLGLGRPRSRSSGDAGPANHLHTRLHAMASRALHPLGHLHPDSSLSAAAGATKALGTSSTGLPVAPSPFLLTQVVRVPFSVEVHRLGVFSFKGGPPQQEMVQVLSTHLLGRTQLTQLNQPQPTSRKGQLLQRLEGRVGQPVMVSLPVLAQDYHERLQYRVAGTTGLPHKCTGAVAQQVMCNGTNPHERKSTEFAFDTTMQSRASLSSSLRGSQSVTLPVRSSLEHIRSSAAAAAAAPGSGAEAGCTAGARSAPLGAVCFELGASQQQQAVEMVEQPARAQGQEGVAATTSGKDGGVHIAGRRDLARSHKQRQRGKGQATEASAPSARGAEECDAVTAPRSFVPGTAGESHVVDVQSLQTLTTRHDSFKSVDEDSIAAAAGDGDEETGQQARSPGPMDGPRSKSETLLGRPLRTRSRGVLP